MRNAPIEFVRAVIATDPQALLRVKKRNPFEFRSFDCTPLGFFRRISLDLVRVFLREMVAYKQQGQSGSKQKGGQHGSSRGFDDFFPFASSGWDHHFFSVEELRVLLEEFPEGATMPLARILGTPTMTMAEYVLLECHDDEFWWESCYLWNRHGIGNEWTNVSCSAAFLEMFGESPLPHFSIPPSRGHGIEKRSPIHWQTLPLSFNVSRRTHLNSSVWSITVAAFHCRR